MPTKEEHLNRLRLYRDLDDLAGGRDLAVRSACIAAIVDCHFGDGSFSHRTQTEAFLSFAIDYLTREVAK
jgi:hypothetical protein